MDACVRLYWPFLFVAIISLCGVSYGTKGTFVIGEVPKRDSDRPIYQVHLPPIGGYETTYNPPDGDLPPGMTTMRMVTARGQVMRCLLPEVRSMKIASPTPSDVAQRAEEARFDDIEGVLKEYENKCFLRTDDWWTYEFCYGQYVVQKHIIPKNRHPYEGEVEVSFVLGLFDRNADLLRRRNASDVSYPDAAFTQLFTNGTECDMTGKPRRTLVKYLCSDDAVRIGGVAPQAVAIEGGLNILNKVREIESCVYEVEFLNRAICRHATYREKAANVARPIHCSLEITESPFEGLRSIDYYKASLNL